MLEPTVSALCDALARCVVMRAADLFDARVLMSASKGRPLSSEFVTALGRREVWREQSEDAHCQSLRALMSSPLLVSKYQEQQKRWSGAKDVSEEAAACIYGRFMWEELKQHLLYDLIEDAKVGATIREVLTGAHIDPLVQKLTTSGTSRTSAGEVDQQTVPFLARMRDAGAPGPNMSRHVVLKWALPNGNTNASAAVVTARDGLLHISRQLRLFAWLWLRRAAHNNQLLGGEAVADIFMTFIALQRKYFSELYAHGKCEALCEVECTGRNASWLDKWSKCLRLVAIMQASARRWLSKRRWGAEVASRIESKRQERTNVLQQRVIPGALQYMRNTQMAVEQLVELSLAVQSQETCLEDFFQSEEVRFQAQWTAYVRKLTQFYLKDCPLDVDWEAHSGPNGSITFVNMKTGRSQQENPNALKVVAAKNRQWLKASRERELRIANARAAAADLNRMKEQLRLATRPLEKMPFL